MAKKDPLDGCFKWWAFPMKKRFPTFSVLLLLIGIVWLLAELDIILVSVPWWPVIIIALALWGIIDYMLKE